MEDKKNMRRFDEPSTEGISGISQPDLSVVEMEVIDEECLPKRVSLNMREAVEDAFSALGGTAGLVNWVRESTANTRIFYRDMLPKLIPKEHKIEGGVDSKLTIEWAGGPPDPAKLTEKAPNA